MNKRPSMDEISEAAAPLMALLEKRPDLELDLAIVHNASTGGVRMKIRFTQRKEDVKNVQTRV